MKIGDAGHSRKTPGDAGERPAKRMMKSPYQLEVLEKTYADEPYPSEARCSELSTKIGLTDRQLKMWFCHRRLKDRKAPPAKRQRMSGEEAPLSLSKGVGLGSIEFSGKPRRAVSGGRIGNEMEVMRTRCFELPPTMQSGHRSAAEVRLVEAVEAQLGESIREDGPALGVEFDPLPPGAFGAPIESTPSIAKQPVQPYGSKLFERHDSKTLKSTFLPGMKHGFLQTSSNGKRKPSVGGYRSVHPRSGRRAPQEYQFLPEQPSDHPEPCDRVPQPRFCGSLVEATVSRVPPVTSSGQLLHVDQNAEARISEEVEARERHIRKELGKQNSLIRKREGQMQREMERHDRERKKEEEKMMREKQREEERFLREQQREHERKEKFLQKESMRVERMRQKEELQREKEAARQRAANERATARKIAREYMELIEDERLELMELAASSKGFSSIFSLDSDTLQHLSSFQDMLSAFPPSSVQLKRPFAIQPWENMEDNVANLLMVWKFLITFADVLGLWPFTLDEFVQSLHDYDSRLLREIHMAVLKSIIKDIEDVARTPAVAPGSNHNSAASPCGGHQKIVEGAYLWGFNIHSWQRCMNHLTWPEILRQFALSAGLGPQLKHRNLDQTYHRDENADNDGKDIISAIRNGSAAQHAVALMKKWGYANPRRSRHRLTPGTVKFAAYHVLSLEGSKGLTILDVADKIQKSGLRDLTTSKTPEASVAAALSRDTMLFERIAPCTYCVKEPYRKDPADVDTILSAARQKIQAFQRALLDSEKAEKATEDVDDAERYEDSDCDAADDPKVDDSVETMFENVDALGSVIKSSRMTLMPVKGKSNVMCCEVGVTSRTGNSQKEKRNAAVASHSSDFREIFHDRGNAEMVDTEIDESNFGESWVHGLSEGDYCDLSVEERLNALVALVGVAIEGNSFRTIIEERMEVASALKKQMWAEAQFDKRRFREEYSSRLRYTSLNGYKNDTVLTEGTGEGSQTPAGTVDKGNGGNLDTINNDQFFDQQDHVDLTSMSAEKISLSQELSAIETQPMQPYGYAAEKARSQLKSYIGHKAEQLYMYRSLPLGQDRRHNNYWLFCASASANDPGSGRIFYESIDGRWMLIDTEEAFDALLSALDTRGVRESNLHFMLQRVERMFKEAIRRKCALSAIPAGHNLKPGNLEIGSSPDCSTEFDSPKSSICGLGSDMSEYSTSFFIELGRNEIEKKTALKRYQGFSKWMGKECYNANVSHAMEFGKKRCSDLLHICESCFQSSLSGERHCPSCHKTFKGIQSSEPVFSEHMAQCDQRRKLNPDWKFQDSDSSLPIGIRLVKAHLALMEVSIPAEALQSYWTDGYRKSWAVKLNSSSSAEELLQMLTLLEGAIKRVWLSSSFATTNQLLTSDSAAKNGTDFGGSVSVLPWVPVTVAAVAFRLFDIDSAISYTQQRLEANRELETGDYFKLPSGSTIVKNVQELDSLERLDLLHYPNEGLCLDSGKGRQGRGQGNRGRGGRGHSRAGMGLRVIGSSHGAHTRDESIGNFAKVARNNTTRGQKRGRGGRTKGRRSIRPRQRSDGKPIAIQNANLPRSFNVASTSIIMEGNIEECLKSSGGAECGFKEARKPFDKDDEVSLGSQSDDNGHASGEEYDHQAADYPVDNYNMDKPMVPIDDDTEEDDDTGDMEGDDEVEVDLDRNGDDEEMEDEVEDIGDQEGDVDEGGSSFSDCSD